MKERKGVKKSGSKYGDKVGLKKAGQITENIKKEKIKY